MASKRSAGRPRGKPPTSPAAPNAPRIVKLTVRMTEEFRWRLRSYAADERKDVDALVVEVLTREMAGWYTARRGPDPAEGEAPGGEPLKYVG